MPNFEKIMQTKGVVEIILYLLDNPEGVQKIQLREELGLISNSQIKAHKILFEFGIISNKPDLNRHIFVLTDKGKKIGEYLKEIRNLMITAH